MAQLASNSAFYILSFTVRQEQYIGAYSTSNGTKRGGVLVKALHLKVSTAVARDDIYI